MFRVWGFWGIMVSGLGFRVMVSRQRFRFMVSGLGSIGVLGYLRNLGMRVQGLM